jgi:hypothetical protein
LREPAPPFFVKSVGTARETIGLGDDGSIAFSERESNALITIVDSRGQVVRRIGLAADSAFRSGLTAVFLDASRVYAVSSDPRIVTWDRAGRALGSKVLAPSRAVVAFHGDSVDVLELTGILSGGSPVELHRESLREPGGRRVVAATDSVLRDLSRPNGVGRFQRIGVATASRTALVVSPRTYEMVRYDLQSGKGVRLPQRDGAAPPMRTGDTVRFDPRWMATAFRDDLTIIVGQSAGTAVVDIFRDGAFVGRLATECLLAGRGAAVNRNWLALACRDAASPSQVSVRLYRLRGS